MPMRMVRPIAVACLGLAALPAARADDGPRPPGFPPAPQHRSEQEEVLRQRREGRMLPLREIERRVLPTMPGASYIGFDFDSDTAIYTLKFLRNGSVIWVDVDGRSGQVIRRGR